MRDSYIITGICVLSVALGAWLYFGSPDIGTGGAAAVIDATQVGVQQIAAGTLSHEARRINYRVMNEDEWGAVWAVAYGGSSTPPAIDFSKDEVYAAFDGQHDTGGYSVTIESVKDTQSARTVTIVHTAPGSSCITDQAVTSPFVFIAVPTSDLSLIHRDQVVTSPCN